MNQRIVIGPGTDSFDPAFEEFEVGASKLRRDAFEQHDREGFLFQHFSPKKLVANPKQVGQAVLR
jgi:hypothetical protein